MIGDEEERSTADNYRRFAELEARLKSPLYQELASGVAQDSELLEALASLPVPKRQPNLVFAAVRHLFGTPEDYRAFRGVVLGHWEELRAAILARRTQTNEVGRCAVILPLLAQLSGPVALLEVGASAGLCLLLDRYRYDYGSAALGPVDSPVLVTCEARGATPVPRHMPEVVWRAGLDLDPVDVNDPGATGWLEALVWPGQEHRLHRLRAAVELARRDPPRVVRGDLRSDLTPLAAQAPAEAALVVVHSGVLSYVPAGDRALLADAVARSGAIWIANEAAHVLPAVRQRLSDTSRCEEGAFLLSYNGRPVAWADPHGAWLEWL